MKGMKAKLLTKLKTVKTIGYLNPERILQVNASDWVAPNSPPNSNVRDYNRFFSVQEEPQKNFRRSIQAQEPEIVDVPELMKDLEDQELDSRGGEMNDKENIRPTSKVKVSVFMKKNEDALSPLMRNHEDLEVKEHKVGDKKAAPLADISASHFRRPDLDCRTPFDPNLLEAFEQAVMEVRAQEAERRAKFEEEYFEDTENHHPLKAQKSEETENPLHGFEEKCPPGGSDSVILYTTGLRGIRKTFEDCQSIRFLLKIFRVLFFERDVSMHSKFKVELWEVLGGKVVPPRLFIKGRYIGGAEVVLGLHEQGRFRPLLEGIPVDSCYGCCEACAGVRFIMCFNCNGSRKITPDDNDGQSIKCPHCNENGLLICPMCS